MSLEHNEELAALYALDLLEGKDLAQFEAMLSTDPLLQTLARELRETSARITRLAPEEQPPDRLKARVLASIATTSDPVGRVVSAEFFSFKFFTPWALAACLTLTSAWLARLYLTTHSENILLQERSELAGVARQSAVQRLEAERILARQQIQDLGQQLATNEKAKNTAQAQLATLSRQMSETGERLAERDRIISAQNQRIDTLTGASTEIGRQLGEAKQIVAGLTDKLKSQSTLANLKITTLASMLNNSPEARAVALWDPLRQEGVLRVEKLPALNANEDYQLWVVDPQYPNPVDGGVFSVDSESGEGRISFRAKQPVKAINAFAVTRERKGGVPKAEGPFVLLGK
ncbi:MAG: hypothetical protein RIQ93_2350 [Verrucomicrobiota bacterium]|jgi:anti-sigma-K factor RskA